MASTALKNNVSFGFLNFQTVESEVFFVYGMIVGIETKLFLAFRKAKPIDADRVQQLALEVYAMYSRDILNPFHDASEGPSPNFKASLEIMLK